MTALDRALASVLDPALDRVSGPVLASAWDQALASVSVLASVLDPALAGEAGVVVTPRPTPRALVRSNRGPARR